MNRLLGTFILGICTCLGLAIASACASPPEIGERSAPRVELSPARALSSASTTSPSVTETVSATSTTDLSQFTISPTATRTTGASENTTIPVYGYEIVNVYPHDPDAFTQGLVYEEDVLFEGTGLRGRSTLRTVELETGNVLRLHRLPVQLFGEGVTVLGDKVFQLTWQAQVGFVYDKDSFELLREFTYPTEGWGLTHDGQRLIMSDGTSTLYFLDPETLEEIGQVEVYDDNGPVLYLNELEYIRGEVYANVWKTDRIARIDPGTGQVTGWIDLTGLLSEQDRSQPVDVLNGIAYDEDTDRLFVTGKLWPKIFQIELVPDIAEVK